MAGRSDSSGRVQLSASDLSSPSRGQAEAPRRPSPVARPRLRSLVVVPENRPGPSRSRFKPQGGGWFKRVSKKVERRGFVPLPTSRPCDKVPPSLWGKCYNCGEPGHVSAKCTNDTVCVKCGDQGHESRECTKRPRSPAEAGPSAAPAPNRRRLLSPVQQVPAAAPPLPTAPPVMAPLPPLSRIPSPPPVAAPLPARSWCDVARPTAAAPLSADFSVPFDPEEVVAVRAAEAPLDAGVEVCVLAPSAGMVALEDEMQRAMVVMITGARPAVDLADAAAAIHAQLHLTPYDFSIRAYFPADFLILCNSVQVREVLARAPTITGPGFTLALRPWLRQDQATMQDAPFLATVDMFSIPGHAWELRTAQALLLGSGWIQDVAPATAQRWDMSKFTVRVWTRSPEAFPARKWLDVLEPDEGARLTIHRGALTSGHKKALRYAIRFAVTKVVKYEPPSTAIPPPPPSSSDQGGGGSHGATLGNQQFGGGGADQGPRRQGGNGAGSAASSEDSVTGPRRVLPHQADVLVNGGGGRGRGARLGSADGSISRQNQTVVGSSSSPAASQRGCSHRSSAASKVWRPVTLPSSTSAKLVAGGSPAAFPREVSAIQIQKQAAPLGADVENATPVSPRAQLVSEKEAEPLLGSSSHLEMEKEAAIGAGPLAVYVQTAPTLGRDETTFDPVLEDLPSGTGSCGSLGGSGSLAYSQDRVSPCSFGSPIRCSLEVELSDSPVAPRPDPPTGPSGSRPASRRQGQRPGPKTKAAGKLKPTALCFKSPSPGPAKDNGKDPEQLQQLISQIRAHIDSPLLPLPDVQTIRRRRYKFVPESERRRSSRLAMKARSRPASAAKRSQQLLMVQLGIAVPEETISDQHLAQYAEFFDGPLPPMQVQALAALFGLTIPTEEDDAAALADMA